MPPKKKTKMDDSVPAGPIFKGTKFAFAGIASDAQKGLESAITSHSGSISTGFSYDVRDFVLISSNQSHSRPVPIERLFFSSTSLTTSPHLFLLTQIPVSV